MTNLHTFKIVTYFSTLFLSIIVSKPLCIGQAVIPVAADSSVPSPLWSLGIGVGITTLPSLQTTYRFQKRWAIRAGYDYLSYDKTAWSVAQDKVSLDVQVRMSKFVFLAHYLPFHTEKFGILTGFAFFPNKNLAGTLRLAQDILVNKVTITPSAVGTAFLKLGYSTPFAPYLGMTFGRPVPIGKTGWRFDIGAYYTGAFDLKQLTIDSNIFLQENESNIGVLERNLNQLPLFYRLIPDLKVVWVCRL